MGVDKRGRRVGIAALAQWICVAVAACIYLLSRELDDERLGALLVLVVPIALASLFVLVEAIERDFAKSTLARWGWFYAVFGLFPIGATAYWMTGRWRTENNE
jgi:hypothetical protein